MKMKNFRVFKILFILCLTVMLGNINAKGQHDEDKHIDKRGHAHNQLLITQVNVDFSGGVIYIYGKNLQKRGGPSLVILADNELVTLSVSEDQITAYLNPGTVAGDYLLTVRAGKHSKYQDNYALTVGAAGPQGATGLTGPQGETGAAGPQGATGLTGLKGDTGAAGPQGATGLTGLKGDTGAAGPQGATGLTGLKGDTGAAGPQGATGLTGLKGDTGAAGPQGATGLTGLKGDTGAAGPQGATGLTGLKGDTGAAGPQGATGLKGDTGAAGPQGATGLTGLKGDTGAAGPQGEPGGSGYELLQELVSTPNGIGQEKPTPTCPVGKVAISGGIMDNRFPITISNSRDFNIAAIHPSGTQSWRVRWFNGTGATAKIILYTICINSSL